MVRKFSRVRLLVLVLQLLLHQSVRNTIQNSRKKLKLMLTLTNSSMQDAKCGSMDVTNVSSMMMEQKELAQQLFVLSKKKNIALLNFQQSNQPTRNLMNSKKKVCWVAKSGTMDVMTVKLSMVRFKAVERSHA